MPPERRQGQEQLIKAVTDIAVLKSEFDRFEKTSLANHQTTRELIRSTVNDIKTIIQTHHDFNAVEDRKIATELSDHEAADVIMRSDIDALKNTFKNIKWIIIAGIAGAMLVSKGFDATVKLIGAFIGG